MTGPRDAAPHPMPAQVLAARSRAELVASEAEVTAAIDRVSVRLSVDIGESNPLLLTVLHGALPFAGALLPRLNFPLEIGYLHVSRYRDATRGGSLEWHARPDYSVKGRVVLLVDDVLDRGDTLAALVRWARDAGAAAVYSTVLVDKRVAGERPVSADYVALQCPDRYLFGWGMDFRGYWRNLPAIYALPNDMDSPDGNEAPGDGATS